MKALILVDVQNDFMSGGPLEVPDAECIIPAINTIQFRYDLVATTQDWHPPNHQSFASRHEGKNPLDIIDLHGLEQVLWPDHCIWETVGADFHPDLLMGPIAAIFRKGMDPRIDSYSGFYDNGRQHSTGLADWLRSMKVKEVHVAGLAAEFCATYTARDAASEGFATTLLLDCTRPLKSEDFEAAQPSLKEAGVKLLNADEALAG